MFCVSLIHESINRNHAHLHCYCFVLRFQIHCYTVVTEIMLTSTVTTL